MKLTETQEKIIYTKGNLIVSASAGTGKTHTMVAKISHELLENKDHRVIAAITFTIKAAQEIKDRLSINIVGSFIGTNNSFVIEEVIKPFMKDTYGSQYDCDMTTDYGLKIRDFEDGLKRNSDNFTLGSYSDSKKNFIFELALKILKNSEVARLYLQAKYFKIYVDEYQDCGAEMNEFFMYLTNVLKIDLFIVGDDKQSLYTFLGAKPETFIKILKDGYFTPIFMSDNFRSNMQIQNFSNLLFEKTAGLYKPQKDLHNIIILNCINNDWVEAVKKYWDENQSSALLRSKNGTAESGAELLNNKDMGFKFIPKLPIDEIANESAWIYQSIAQYIFIDTYSVHDFIYDIPMGIEDDSNLKRKLEKFLKNIDLNKDDKSIFLDRVSALAVFLGYTTQIEDLDLLYVTISKDDCADSFKQDNYKHKAMTCHASKGLQFEQVIIFAEDFFLKSDDDLYKHYVAVTRAKNKLIIVCSDSWHANKYKEMVTTLLAKYNLEMKNVIQID